MSTYDRADPGADPAYCDGLGMTRSEPREHPAFTRAKALPDHLRHLFPTSAAEAARWRPTRYTNALARQVLVVAQTRIECAWSAYCDAVPGIDYDIEIGAVCATGAKLTESLARVLFPRFDAVPYAE